MKTHTTLSVDAELLNKAKKMGTNMSEALEKALVEKLSPMKKDFNDESLKIICSVCKKEITLGYRCEMQKIAICDDCHKNFDMKKCDIRAKEHIHQRFGEDLEPL